MAIAEWKYPFPSRTRKSSALTPMALRKRGRVGSRQALFFALLAPRAPCRAPSIGPYVMYCPSLGSAPCAAVRFGWSPSSACGRFASSVRAKPCTQHCLRTPSLRSIPHPLKEPPRIMRGGHVLDGFHSLHAHPALNVLERTVRVFPMTFRSRFVASVTFVPSVASVVHAHCPLLERISKCGQLFVRFSPKNKNADIPLV